MQRKITNHALRRSDNYAILNAQCVEMWSTSILLIIVRSGGYT